MARNVQPFHYSRKEVAAVVLSRPGDCVTPAGFGGFGDNEAHGKILPCHRVREDGLMRINPTTVCSALGLWLVGLTYVRFP